MRCLLMTLMAALAAFALHAERWAQVSIPVTCMRSAPSHAAEQCSQAILGTPVQIALEEGDWYKVNTPDGYTGWVKHNTVTPISCEELDDWKHAPRVVCKSWMTRLYDENGNPDGYAPYGAILAVTPGLEADQGWVGVTTPDRKTLRVMAEDVWQGVDAWIASFTHANATDVTETARGMLGAPYLWGGTSSLAPDCSGFTQIAFMSAGMLLPRDTSMQIKCGVEVPSLADALPGDLVFYGNNGRVNHVAIYLGDKKIIHSSGHVRICRMEPVSGSEEIYADTPLCIRRVLGTPSDTEGEAAPGVPAIAGNPWFF